MKEAAARIKINKLLGGYRTQSRALMTGGGQPQFNGNAVKQVRLPLPSIAVQQDIVTQPEAEQALVNANRELIARFEKKIQGTLARVWGEDGGATDPVTSQ